MPCLNLQSGRQRHLIGTATTVGLALTLGSATGALAQSAPTSLSQAIQRKYDIAQQEIEAERFRAETQRRQVERQQQEQHRALGGGEGSRFTGSTIPSGVDALAGTDAPSYRLDNGAILRVSGIFWPSAQATCIAFCSGL